MARQPEWIASVSYRKNISTPNVGAQDINWGGINMKRKLLIALGFVTSLIAITALAFSQHKERFDFAGESLQFKGTVTTHYRVWC
jgi:hypothetical protein